MTTVRIDYAVTQSGGAMEYAGAMVNGFDGR